MTCPSLEQLAQDALAALDGRMPAQDHARLAAAGDLEKLQFRYTHADSALFARTVAAVTGWSVLALTSPEGPLSCLVTIPGEPAARLVDVTGFVNESNLRQRYDTLDLAIVPAAASGDDHDHDHLAVVQLLVHLDYAPFNGLDFQRQLLAFCATLRVDPDDLPVPVSREQLAQAARDRAIQGDYVGMVNRFLAQALADPPQGGAAVEIKDAITTCGYKAAESNHAAVVQAFLDAIEVPITFEWEGHSWLHVATVAGAVATVRVLLAHPRSAHLVNEPAHDTGRVPLNIAALRHKHDIVAELLAGGAKVDAQRAYTGQTALHACLSAQWGSDDDSKKLATAELLLSHGASPSLFDKVGNAALHFVARAGLVDLAQSLVEQGVPVDHTRPDKGVAPIFRAVESGSTDMVECLRVLGADTSAHSSGGHTLLTHCIVSVARNAGKMYLNGREYGMGAGANLKMIQHLLEVVGLDPDQPTLHGETPDALAMDLPEVRQVLSAFRARRAMAAALAAADKERAGGAPQL